MCRNIRSVQPGQRSQQHGGTKKNAGNFEHAPIVRNAEADSSLLVSREDREENKGENGLPRPWRDQAVQIRKISNQT